MPVQSTMLYTKHLVKNGERIYCFCCFAKWQINLFRLLVLLFFCVSPNLRSVTHGNLGPIPKVMPKLLKGPKLTYQIKVFAQNCLKFVFWAKYGRILNAHLLAYGLSSLKRFGVLSYLSLGYRKVSKVSILGQIDFGLFC